MIVTETHRPHVLSWLLPRFSLFRSSRRRPPSLSVIDWNGHPIGLFLPGKQFNVCSTSEWNEFLGEPLIIQNSQRKTIARCNRLSEDGWEWPLYIIRFPYTAYYIDTMLYVKTVLSISYLLTHWKGKLRCILCKTNTRFLKKNINSRSVTGRVIFPSIH